MSADGSVTVTPFGKGNPPGADVTLPLTSTSIVAFGS
jgi:hypothetical protein